MPAPLLRCKTRHSHKARNIWATKKVRRVQKSDCKVTYYMSGFRFSKQFHSLYYTFLCSVPVGLVKQFCNKFHFGVFFSLYVIAGNFLQGISVRSCESDITASDKGSNMGNNGNMGNGHTTTSPDPPFPTYFLTFNRFGHSVHLFMYSTSEDSSRGLRGWSGWSGFIITRRLVSFPGAWRAIAASIFSLEGEVVLWGICLRIYTLTGIIQTHIALWSP